MRACILLLVLSGCGLSVDLDSFDRIPPLESLDVDAMQPATAVDYWELRAWGGEVLASAGTPDSSVVDDLNLVDPQGGFGADLCHPGICVKQIVSTTGTTIETWTSSEEVRTFLGDINTAHEAALLAFSKGYYWKDDKETGAVKTTADGYELVVLDIISVCKWHIDRVHLSVAKDGTFTVIDSEVWDKSNACS